MSEGGAPTVWSIGSQWQRWDPHLHAPGTLRNNQFKQDWDGYMRALESADPAPVALGITDYFCLRTYKEVLRRVEQGALARVPLVFPNIELRLTIETKDRHGINLHLLVCPDDGDHVARIEEALGGLVFDYHQERYVCTEEGLRRLGKAHRRDPNLDGEAALGEGANQFKIELSAIRSMFDSSAWVRDNVLVAVAAGDDGLSGIASDASFHGSREELGRFAHVIFSGSPRDRAYWLGEHPDFRKNGQTPKPCLQGSDAHSLATVLKPDQGRRCWIRSGATFDGLRQTLVEPGRRVHIGETPPAGPSPSNTIRCLRVRGAEWLTTQEMAFNEGLVTVIGARGSGKTALADLLAFAAHADEARPGPASFVSKAGRLLDGVEVELEWADGTRSGRRFGEGDLFEDEPEPRVRYLSQQFVEHLCTPGTLGEPLVEEIERVVFSAIPEEDRLECTSFDELRTLRVADFTWEQQSHRDTIRTQTGSIADEQALQRALPVLAANVQKLEREVTAFEKDLAAVPLNVDEKKLKAQQAAETAVRSLKVLIASTERRARELHDVIAEIRRQNRSANDQLAAIKVRFPTLAEHSFWEKLRLDLPADLLPLLERLEAGTSARATNLRVYGTVDVPPDGSKAGGLASIEAVLDQATKDLGADQSKVARRSAIEQTLKTSRQALEKALKDVNHAKLSSKRVDAAGRVRLDAYEAVFNAIVAEEVALTDLYSPVRRRIEADKRLSKLSFSVSRVVDVDTWAARGEGLFDLRRPPFQGKGQLVEASHRMLLGHWTRGTATDVRAAMEGFLDQYASQAVAALLPGVTPMTLGEWIFSTDHIAVRYSIRYEGQEIAKLSPGTRGIVLLELYLGLDEWDLRPLVIDQPEENLDPRSVYSELAPYFRDAARRRQVIMVTHNANLVVNTDSDQVIVAEAERTSAEGLPSVQYSAGGLEDPAVRSEVCRLLEGGKEAFKKRALRYGNSPSDEI